ncbi:MAG: N-6 DNA methylase [Deltaproteobacteria bacterium]|jgi:hypothetical protein|nr:N-6 DNA methylase [Deltaproteobacteria bacterium]
MTTLDYRISKAVAYFSVYSDEIEAVVFNSGLNNERDINEDIVPGILNGETTLALQRLVPINVRKKAGIFFTSTILSDKVADHLAPILRTGVKLIDPACGAGNLLLACAKYLPSGCNLQDTLKIWSNHILGYDLHYEFIRAAQLRLTFLAASIHPDETITLAHLQPANIFKGLKVGDVFAHTPVKQNVCMIVNPPFGYMQAPEDCQWAAGKIQIAGWFLEKLLRTAPEGQHVVAILPDVLRSGTRYRKWRNMLSALCVSIDIELAGRFDTNTDVDVFILHAVVGIDDTGQLQWPIPRLHNRETRHIISDFFDVHVGSVVPHRDSLEGPSYPYIHARMAPAWQTIDHISEERPCRGTVFFPPFVVVHRTSSPSDKNRCVATIVNEKRKVAVENHLLVLLPHDKSLQSCKQLLEVLKSPQSSEWLNERIRCRHLTVVALRELPYCSIRSYTK